MKHLLLTDKWESGLINGKQKPMKTFNELVAASEHDGLFEMANLPPKRTGLPFVVWIFPKADTPNDVCVKIPKGQRSIFQN
jgi:hypothetical protein